MAKKVESYKLNMDPKLSRGTKEDKPAREMSKVIGAS